MDVKTAIETGDAAALRRLLAEVPTLANELIRWGKDCRITTHPLHYVSDIDFQRNGEGDTPLIGAASLGAEEVGLRLLDAEAHMKRSVNYS